LACVGSQVRHEVRHGRAVDVVITGDTTHVCWEHSFRLDVVSNQLSSVQKLNCFCDFVKQNHMPSWVHLKLIVFDTVGCRVLLYPLEKE
jgi:hypothetical protein